MKVNLGLNSQLNIRNNTSSSKDAKTAKNPNFGNGSVIGSALTTGLQACQQHPMVGVSVIDAATCIVPRAAVDFKTNAHAGLETLRRESSGLLMNCLLPSYFVMGAAALLNNMTLKKEYRNLGMTTSWADEDAIKMLGSHFKKSTKDLPQEQKASAYVRSVLSDIEGLNSSEGGWIKYANKEKAFDSAVNVLSDAINGKAKTSEAISSAYKSLAEATRATEALRFVSKAGETFKLDSMLRDVVDMGSKFVKPEVAKDIDGFTKEAVKFVKHKSFAGLAVILPLAASMQYINRWITRKKSGVEGPPIYKDYTKENKPKVKDSNSKVLAYKALGATAMLGTALLSMDKKPNLKMFQFKGLFPTLDQARWIAAITFTSRILAAEDCNEVRESSIRDMAGFASLYFLGDYVAKLVATGMNKVNPKIDLLNRSKQNSPNAGLVEKSSNWFKHASLKSFDEVPNELKNYRSVCQATSLGVSMLLLGLFIPIWNRKRTEKNVEKANAKLQNQNTTPATVRPETTMDLLIKKWNNKSQPNNAFGAFKQIDSFNFK